MSSNDFLEVIDAVKSDLDRHIREKDKNLSEIIRQLNVTLGLESIFSKEEKETIESLKEILSDLNTEASLSDIDSLLDDIDLGDVDSLLDELDDIEAIIEPSLDFLNEGRVENDTVLNEIAMLNPLHNSKRFSLF